MIKINKWNDTFENADSRKRQRLGWYYTPSGNDSAGYRKLMRNGTDGVIALGFFNSLCQHMATLKREIRINGIFCNNDGSIMDIEDISEVTRISVADIQHACGILVACGWITLDTTTICQSSATNLPLSADDLPTLCKAKAKAKAKSLSPQVEGNPILLSLWNCSPAKARSRSSKAETFNAWQKLKASDKPNEETLIGAMEAWKKSEDWIKEDGQYIKGLHFWIKNKQWENLPEPMKAKGGQSCL